jgi:hypothetical protein
MKSNFRSPPTAIADKNQVQEMVRRLLGMDSFPRTDDAPTPSLWRCAIWNADLQVTAPPMAMKYDYQPSSNPVS